MARTAARTSELTWVANFSRGWGMRHLWITGLQSIMTYHDLSRWRRLHPPCDRPGGQSHWQAKAPAPRCTMRYNWSFPPMNIRSAAILLIFAAVGLPLLAADARSEERRVGKNRRGRGA